MARCWVRDTKQRINFKTLLETLVTGLQTLHLEESTKPAKFEDVNKLRRVRTKEAEERSEYVDADIIDGNTSCPCMLYFLTLFFYRLSILLIIHS